MERGRAEDGSGRKGWKTLECVCRLEQNRSRDGRTENFRAHSRNEQTPKVSFICRKLHQAKSTRTESECRLRSELLELLFGACPSWWHRDVNEKCGCRSLKGWREHIHSDREETRACSLHASLSTPASDECPGDALGLIRLNASVRRCSRAAIEWRDICETLMCVSSLTRSRMALTFTPGKEPDAIIYLRHPPPSSLLEDGAGICH